ncbi:cystathionine beta-lyase [Aquibium sp. ELW1220]|uniref:cystathionine beta-lyase n=1 Tax=Aquibium sp. ELW1220 TaxID=2976766 RepID=UPI0025B03300|nr:cystathionine beta-lyase [Aquibium sp. ELW1220]MDN2582673.1 cystathionine beta-lyase [Aquibium sp. ELW1220]
MDATPRPASIDSILVKAGREHGRSAIAVNPPVHRASTYLFETLADFETASKTPFDGPFYGRVGTPTTFAFEQAVCELEGGHRTIATSSGVAAIGAALLAFLDRGDHVLVVDTVYEPVRRFCNRMLARLGIETTFYDPAAGDDIAGLVRPNTRVIYLESPGSGTFEMQDLRAVVAVARERGLRTIMDNTWATPVFLQPIALGIDVSVQSATKYIVGHSDAMLGTVTTTAETYDAVRRSTQDLGACAGSEECNLGLRGLRTLGVRLRRHEASALTLAAWLEDQPQVARVLHPGLPSFPGHALWKRDFSGACGLFSVELLPCEPASLRAMVDGLRHFGIGFSWGGYESLVLPVHPETRQIARWDGKGPVLRLHVGLEAVEDLRDDLAEGLARLRSA